MMETTKTKLHNQNKMQKRWLQITAEEDQVTALQQDLRVNRAICKMLVQRGLGSFEKARKFFRPRLEDVHSPWLMKDMEKAVQRLLTAFDKQERILVYGDYDVDGTTAVASMYQFLQSVYPKVEYYIPNRTREGYGVSKMGIDFAAANNFSLILSLDCGIKSVELIAYAKDTGIDFIICDHHLPDEILPPAVAILNPKQKDCDYPYKDLCGCGVGFKLMNAMADRLNLMPESYLKYLDLLATAIAADIVSLTGENRIFAYYGLQKINKNPCQGIKALMQLAGVQKEMFLTNLVFVIAPRVNAAGRMDDARKAVQLFVEQDCEKALQFAEMLHFDNSERRSADTIITEEALAIIEGNKEFESRRSTVLYQEHWHKGVVGIVASRLIETHYKPTIVLTRNGSVAAGSARSVVGFNLYEAIHACRSYLLGYGGHFAAAGLTLLPENIPGFSKKFEEVVSSTIQPTSLVPELMIDAEITFKDINMGFYNIVRQMEPFGPENLRPVFLTRKIVDSGQSKIVKENHIKFCLRQGNIVFSGIGFNMAEKFSLLASQKPLDVAFSIEQNEWNGELILQLKVCDLRLAEEF